MSIPFRRLCSEIFRAVFPRRYPAGCDRVGTASRPPVAPTTSHVRYAARVTIHAAILTVSDKGSRGERADTSGEVLQSLLESIGAQIDHRDIVPDERERIAARLREWCDGAQIDLIVTTGGTGIAARVTIRAAILTVSDKGSRGERADISGEVLQSLLESIGAQIAQRDIVADERGQIAATLRDWCDRGEIDLIVTTGGTGLAARDVTPEAAYDIAERLVPGIAEAMRAEGMRHTPKAMLSRGLAAVRGSTLIITLPGSEKGVRESLGAVLDVLPHAVELLRGVTEH